MREEVLNELKRRAGEYVSGEELSNRLNVSRTAIWKYINQLKQAGYKIESQTNKGYRLVESPDSLSSVELKPLLKTAFIGRHILYFDEIDSTNLHAKRLSEEAFEDGTVLIAEEQLKGKGRLGRAWSSPKGKGIWMSIMLKPRMSPSDAAKITLLSACAVVKAIETTCGIHPQIKWPNDIVIGSKKLCGILTEMTVEIDEINCLVVGIGVNVNITKQELLEELVSIATSIRNETGREMVRKEIAAAILNCFEAYYQAFRQTGSIKDFIEEYKQKSAVLGKRVTARSSTKELQGTAVDITEEGQLLLQLENGSIEEIISGEVSIRALDGYI